MALLIIILLGIAVLAVVASIRALRTDGYHRMPSAPIRRTGADARGR